MRIKEFIRNHYEAIDVVIKTEVGNIPIDDEERENWIMNDEGLYNWALSAGVEDI